MSLSIIAYCQSDSIIELPMEMKDGYGPFKSSLRGVAFYIEKDENPWLKTFLYGKGVPTDWTDIKQGSFDTDISQTVYYNYHAGNISPEWYQHLQKSWKWEPDTLNLSKENIRTQIIYVRGKNSLGETKMIIDANNNMDFSDDEIFTPPVMDMDATNFDMHSLIDNTPKRIVEYERLSNNKIIRESAPLLFFQGKNPQHMWMCNIGKYAVTQFDDKEIAISFNDFHSLSGNDIKLVIMNDSLRSGKKVALSDATAIGQYLIDDDKMYINKGVDKNRNVLILEKNNLPKNNIESTQIGFKAIPFEAKLFNKEEIVSLKDYQGKYLFIDFWAIWCAPCIKEFPFLKSLYENVDKSKIEFLGIAGESKAESVEKMIEKYQLVWPQILSDNTNQITKLYRINGYPTTLLIDPEGIIIAKNLRGKDLENKIKELIK